MFKKILKLTKKIEKIFASAHLNILSSDMSVWGKRTLLCPDVKTNFDAPI
jgi:hypothetical protein